MANDMLAPLDKSRPLLITGAAGFMGRNLAARLGALGYSNLLLFDVHTPAEKLADYARQAAFVFHLAGVNRPRQTTDFYDGNAGLTERLLALLAQAGNTAPVLLTSSAQAALNNDYGKSKAQAEALVFEHALATGAPAFVFRLPGVFGKWSRPAYNSVVATFCHNIANGLPIEIRDANFALPLVYIDDVVDAFVAAAEGRRTPSGSEPLEVSPVYTTTLGQLAGLIHSFHTERHDLAVPNMSDPFTAKMHATYLSYLPREEFVSALHMNVDERGSFTEFLRTPERGQVSVNVAKPGITKGNHWHDTKTEKFLVVKGRAVIRFRQIGQRDVFEYSVKGENLQVVEIPPGYTHNIQNTGDEDLITVMWASEPFNPQRPDTYFEEV